MARTRTPSLPRVAISAVAAAVASASSAKRALTRARRQAAVAATPGSSNTGSSAALPASASSTEVESASRSWASASQTLSTAPAGTSSVRACIARRPSTLVLIEPAFEVVDARPAFDELGVDHQLAVQRDIGRDAFDHGLRERGAHPRQRLVAA